MSEHTPGPWTVREKVGPHLNTYYTIWADKLGMDGNIVRTYAPIDVQEHPDQQEANARLISAAPDLLRALQEVAHHADDEYGFMVDVRAAIVKATGEDT